MCITDEEFDRTLRDFAAAKSGSQSSDILDLGTFELVEGDPARGYAHLFFTGHRLEGNMIFARSADQHAAMVTRNLNLLAYPPSARR